MRVLDELEQRAVADESKDREAWLAARREGITATEVATLAKSPAAAFRLREEKQSGVSSFTGNKWTAWGKEREPIIAARYAGIGLLPTSKLYRSKDDRRFLASPDMIGEDFDESLYLGEIKTSKHNLAPEGDYFRTTTYYDQMQWQMFVTGARWCSFIWEQHDNEWTEQFDGSFGPTVRDLRSVSVERDDDRIEHLYEIAVRFLDGGTLDGTDADLEQRVADAKAWELEAKAELVSVMADAERAWPDGHAFESRGYRYSLSAAPTEGALRLDQKAFDAHLRTIVPDFDELREGFMKRGAPGKPRFAAKEIVDE